MSLVQALPDGPLDVVGDIHGEYEALLALLGHLGYDEQGCHPQGRSLVFVGDFCDRGPDSPAVLNLAQRLVESGRAKAVLGNHEINLLREDPKDGSGWYFDERQHSDAPKYAPFARLPKALQQSTLEFLQTLPLALERADLRIVHAAWVAESIAAVRQVPTNALQTSYSDWEMRAAERSRESNLQARMQEEQMRWPWSLEDKSHIPPMLCALAEHEANEQMLNPIKILTSGVERPSAAPFYTSGKWRFAERVAWWDSYEDDTPVVVGHYWRRLDEIDRAQVGKQDVDLFAGVDPLTWHGKKGNVFCVDFSAGGRWKSRKDQHPPASHFKLAALRWPENQVVFDDGQCFAAQGFMETATRDLSASAKEWRDQDRQPAAAARPPMNRRLANPPLDADTRVLISEEVQLDDYPAWHQVWRWEGIEGHSLIFPTSSVPALDDAALKALVVGRGYAEEQASFTFARRDEWTFVNFNFRELEA